MNPPLIDCSRRRALVLGAAAAASAVPNLAAAQSRYPDRAITLVVPFAPAGIADITARAVAEPMAHTLGQAVVIDNRPSAGSIVASQLVAQARPDGHTLLLMSNSHALSATLFKKLPFDALRDFAPISTLGSFDIGLFAASNGRVTSLQGTLALARAQPGKLTLGSIAVGSTQHLAAELFKTVTGIDALIVPYRGSPALLTALRSGEIDIAFEILGPMLAQVASGSVRALALAAEQRNPALPAAPTALEAGVRGYVVSSWNALAAPAGTPPAVIERLNAAVREALVSTGVQQRLGALGMRLGAGSPAQMHALLATEMARWAGVIRGARIEPE